MDRSQHPQNGPTHHIHWSVHVLAVSSFPKHALLGFLPLKSCLVTAKAKHLVGFIDAPVYPGTNPAVAKLTSPREHPTAKGPPRGPNRARWRGSRATPKARALHAKKKRMIKKTANVVGRNSQQSKARHRLDQKCLAYSHCSGISKATAAFESGTNVRADW